MAQDAKTRQRSMRARRLEGTSRQKAFWISDFDDQALRQKFPGHAGGVRWADVIKAALAAPSRW